MMMMKKRFFGTPIKEDDNGSDIISRSAFLGLIKEKRSELRGIEIGLSCTNHRDGFLRTDLVPKTIACHDQKVVLLKDEIT